MTTDEVLSAFIDGELPPEEMEEVRREVEKSPALSARVEALKAADRLVVGAYGAIGDEPMPQRVLDLLENRGGAAGSNVVEFSPGRRSSGVGRYWPSALAASLALAVGVGLGLQFSGGGALIAGAIEKGSPLYAALETTPSAETVTVAGRSGAKLTPVLSFRSQTGDFCREFLVISKHRGNRAVACRQGDQWAVEFAVAVAPRDAGGSSYATASSELDGAFETAVGDMIADAPLAPEEEAALIESGWKADR